MSRPTAIIPITNELTQGHNWLIYGEPGVGKTPLAASAPNALIVRPPTDNVTSAAVLGTSAQQWIIESHQELTEVEEYFRSGSGCDDFEWVILDTITLFQELGLHDIMTDLHAVKSHREIWAPDKGEFGQNMNRLSIWVRSMKSLPVNFMMVAHVMRGLTLNYEEQLMPAVQGKGMSEKFCGYMGLVALMEAFEKDGTIHRRILTDKHEEYYAKDSYGGVFKGVVIDPTVPKMLQIIGSKVSMVSQSRPAKKAPAKKMPVKKVAAKKAVAQKAVAKKNPAKKATTPRKATT